MTKKQKKELIKIVLTGLATIALYDWMFISYLVR